jgi:hypothetical protein
MIILRTGCHLHATRNLQIMTVHKHRLSSHDNLCDMGRTEFLSGTTSALAAALAHRLQHSGSKAMRGQ